MSVLVVGLSHRSAPVELLERAAVGGDEIPKLLDEMLQGSHVTEVMMLSTCNRIEVYAVVDAFHGGLSDVSGVLGRHAGLPMIELTEHLYVHYAAADAAGTVGRPLHGLSQQALRVGKRVHPRAGIAAAGASVVSEALAAAT